MKKILFITVLILTVILGVAFALAKQNVQGVNLEEGKILVAYFSHSGNTKAIAEKIQSKTGGELFEIKVKEEYPADYTETTEIVKKQIADKVLPELVENKDVSEYDVVFVGTPAWWHTMAPPVKTFLKENNFEGKTIVPFISHGGGGKYNIAGEMGQAASGANVTKPFVVQGKGGLAVDDDIEKWLDEIKF